MQDPDIPEQLLMVPGPTPVPAEVRAYGARPLINHRSAPFRELYARIRPALQAVHQTAHDVVIYPASGTGALETAIVNCFSPGDRILSLCMGAFGERFAEIGTAFGLNVQRIEVPYGQAIDPVVVRQRLQEDLRSSGPHFAGVLCTFNETSTGVLLDLETIAREIRSHGALVLVDAVSGLGGAELKMDAWGCDVVVAGSQKALMTSPGLATVAFGPRAWEASLTAKLPRSYFDWRPYHNQAEHFETPYTPAVSLWYELDAALRRILAEGLPAVFLRHKAMSKVARAAFAASGLPLLAPEVSASPTVTAARLPEGASFTDLSAALEQRGITIAGGLGPMRGKMLRIGHMGGLGTADLLRFFEAFDQVQTELRWPGAGKAAPAAVAMATEAGLR